RESEGALRRRLRTLSAIDVRSESQFCIDVGQRRADCTAALTMLLHSAPPPLSRKEPTVWHSGKKPKNPARRRYRTSRRRAQGNPIGKSRRRRPYLDPHLRPIPPREHPAWSNKKNP